MKKILDMPEGRFVLADEWNPTSNGWWAAPGTWENHSLGKLPGTLEVARLGDTSGAWSFSICPRYVRARRLLADASGATTESVGGRRSTPVALARACFDALLQAGVGAQAADRIAVEEWGLSPRVWKEVRGVHASSLGCYDKRVADRVPTEWRRN